MIGFSPAVLSAAARQPEVELTTYGRKTGEPRRVTIWISTDGQRLFVRSGGGMSRDWPQNLVANDRARLRIGGLEVPVQARQITDPDDARAVTRLVRNKYGAAVQVPPEGAPPTPAERATFELLPSAVSGMP